MELLTKQGIFYPIYETKLGTWATNNNKYLVMLEVFYSMEMDWLEKQEGGFLVDGREMSLMEVEYFSGVSSMILAAIPNSLRFDIGYVMGLVEEGVRQSWLLESIFNGWTERDMVQGKLLELRGYFALRRAFSYAEDRQKQVEYASLTPEGRELPDWFIRYKIGDYERLTRKEILVAHLNDYESRWVGDLRRFDYVYAEEVDEEQVKIHRCYYR